jgi:cell division septum initiation protein DivIVA
MPDQSSAATEHAIIQEITAPLETLPDDPLAVVDANFATVLRGYDRAAVDEYVQLTRRLVAELQATRSPEAAVRRALERVGEQIAGILQRAHETAEQITAQSRSEAEDRLQQARAEAAQIAEAAEQRVRDLDADTDRIWLERQRIVADAEDLSGQLLEVARTAGDRFPADEVPVRPADDAGSADEDDAVADAVAETAEAAPEEELEIEPEPDADPEPDAESQADPGIDRTVAFSPLAPSEDETAIIEDAVERPAPVPRRAAGDSTSVIPPASQAANRRLNQ